MEYGLRVYVRKNGETHELGVLILVLMEYGLRVNVVDENFPDTLKS